MKAILSVVKVLTETKSNWVKGMSIHDVVEWKEPLDPPWYIASGGGTTPELQKAQVFGWSAGAVRNQKMYRDNPDTYCVTPIRLVEEPDNG